MKIVESPDSLFHSDSDLRSKRELHLSTSRNSVLKANVLKAAKVIQDQEKGKKKSVCICIK